MADSDVSEPVKKTAAKQAAAKKTAAGKTVAKKPAAKQAAAGKTAAKKAAGTGTPRKTLGGLFGGGSQLEKEGWVGRTADPYLSPKAPGGSANPTTVEQAARQLQNEPNAVGAPGRYLAHQAYWATTRVNPETGEPYDIPKVRNRVNQSKAYREWIQQEARKRGLKVTGLTGRSEPTPGYTKRGDGIGLVDLATNRPVDPERAQEFWDVIEHKQMVDDTRVNDRLTDSTRFVQRVGSGGGAAGVPPSGGLPPSDFSKRVAAQLHQAIDIGTTPDRVAVAYRRAVQAGRLLPEDAAPVRRRLSDLLGVGTKLPEPLPEPVPVTSPDVEPVAAPEPVQLRQPERLPVPLDTGSTDPRNFRLTAPDPVDLSGSSRVVHPTRFDRLFTTVGELPSGGTSPRLLPAAAGSPPPPVATSGSVMSPSSPSRLPVRLSQLPARVSPVPEPVALSGVSDGVVPVGRYGLSGLHNRMINPVRPAGGSGAGSGAGFGSGAVFDEPPFGPGAGFAQRVARQRVVDVGPFGEPIPMGAASASTAADVVGNVTGGVGGGAGAAGRVGGAGVGGAGVGGAGVGGLAAADAAGVGAAGSSRLSALFRNPANLRNMFSARNLIAGFGAAIPGMAASYAGSRIQENARDLPGSTDRADVGQFLTGLGTAGTFLVPLGVAAGATPLGWLGIGAVAAGAGIVNALRGGGKSFDEKIDAAFDMAVKGGMPVEDVAAWRAEIEMQRQLGASDDEILAELRSKLPAAVANRREQQVYELSPEQMLAYQKAWADIANQISQQEMAYINSAYETYLQEAARNGYEPSPSTRMAVELGKLAAAKNAAVRQWEAATFPYREYVAAQTEMRNRLRDQMMNPAAVTGSTTAATLDNLSALLQG